AKESSAMKRPRRNHTAAFKAKVALAALKGDRTLTELAEKFDVHANQITQWKAQLLDEAIGVFMSPAREARSGAGCKCEGNAGEDRPARGRSRFFGSRARSRRRCERKAMIIKAHPLPVKRPAELLEISRSNVYYLPTPT